MQSVVSVSWKKLPQEMPPEEYQKRKQLPPLALRRKSCEPPLLPRRPSRSGSQRSNADDDSLWRMVSEAHTPRAQDLHELHMLQKKQSEKDEAAQAKQAASISETLRSGLRSQGPRVVQREPRYLDYSATSPRSLEHSASAFVKAMSDAGLRPVIVFHNLTCAELVEKALAYEKGSHMVSSGALATLSGAKTGRSPRDKRLVREPGTQADVWWGEGSPNLEMDEKTFLLNRERAVDYLNMQDRIYVVDGYAGWDVGARYKVRVVCARPYHALFMHNMLIRPSEEELASFGQPDFTIYNAGAFPANRFTSYMTSSTSIDLSFKHREMVILGAQYAGEMKKGVFTLMNYFMPKHGILSLHSGCNMGGGDDGDVTLFFGLSGTGKTTLSADPRRQLIGDDEHCWGDSGVFNIEGGCYAKCIGLSKEAEPDIWRALRFGAVLENVVFDEDTRDVDFNSNSITENTRASYPIEFIPTARIPCVGPHPRNILMLCCDAFGVLPPVSRLSLEQAIYYFISGYTAKVAGTEVGVVEPEATFSACFGSAFLVWHPTKYAALLAEKMRHHGTQAWLINTGWTGGSYGTGYRIRLRHTRAIVDAIHSGELADAECTTLPIFGLQVPIKVPGVPDEILVPVNTWADQRQYDARLCHLAELFITNFKRFEDGGGYMSQEQAGQIVDAGPKL